MRRALALVLLLAICGAVLVTAVVLGTLAAEALALGVAPASPQDAAPADLAALREDGA